MGLEANLARLRSLSPAASRVRRAYRNGQRVLELMRPLCQEPHLYRLKLLVAAHAELGEFEDAITTAEQALDLALELASDDKRASIEEALALYREGKPFRLTTE